MIVAVAPVLLHIVTPEFNVRGVFHVLVLIH